MRGGDDQFVAAAQVIEALGGCWADRIPKMGAIESAWLVPDLAFVESRLGFPC